MLKPYTLAWSALFLCALLFTCTEDDPEIDIADIQFDGDNVTVTEGFTYDLTTAIEVTGSDADQAEISFSSSDASVVSVSGNILTAEKVGTTTVTAIEANSGLTASVEVEVIANIIAVTGIELDQTEANIKVGETVQLKATLSPEDATEKGVSWSIAFPSESKTKEGDPEDIASVSNEGLVTAKSAGEVVVSASSDDGGFSASTLISVTNVAVTGISLSASSLSVNIGETGSLVATITPSNATNKNVIWSLDEDEGSPETFASIDAETGVVTGISECDACGLALIATSEDGSITAAADLFIVYVPVTSITLVPSSFSIEAGETQQMAATIEPENASNKNVTWSIDFGIGLCDAVPSDYATVSATGLVTGIAPEVCDLIVKATAENETGVSSTASINVTVTATAVTIVDSDDYPFDDKSIYLDYLDADMQLYLSFTPANATNTSVTWESDDPEVVDVNASGFISGLSSGTARITVTLNDGSGVSDYVDVDFSEP